jgi:hypothetical protein
MMIPLLVGLFVLAGGYCLHLVQHTRSKNTGDPAATAAVTAEDESRKVGQAIIRPIRETRVPVQEEKTVANTGKTEVQSQQEIYEAYRDERIVYLADLSMQSDMSALPEILSELSNRDPEIRSAAREAAIQFGSRDALPELQKVMSQTDEPHEKADMAKAIELLSLPNVTELTGSD